MSLCCKQFRELSLDDRIWNRLYNSMFFGDDGKTPDAPAFFVRNVTKKTFASARRNIFVKKDEERPNKVVDVEGVPDNPFLQALRSKTKTQTPKNKSYFTFRKDVFFLKNACPGI